MRKLGLIAGGGALPVELAAALRGGRPAVRGHAPALFAEPVLARYPGVEVGLGEFGKVFKALRAEGCEVVCFAGVVDRPDFRGPQARPARPDRDPQADQRRAQGRRRPAAPPAGRVREGRLRDRGRPRGAGRDDPAAGCLGKVTPLPQGHMADMDAP
jgi:hypothetical protein